MTGPRVLLMTLSERTSAKGNTYLSGFLGKARLVGFKAKETDRYGNEVWQIYAQEPDVRDQGQRLPERGQATHDRSRRPRETAAGHVESWSQERGETPFYDDTDAAVRDLTGEGDR